MKNQCSISVVMMIMMMMTCWSSHSQKAGAVIDERLVLFIPRGSGGASYIQRRALALPLSFGPYHSARKQKSKISVVHSLAVLKGHLECLLSNAGKPFGGHPLGAYSTPQTP